MCMLAMRELTVRSQSPSIPRPLLPEVAVPTLQALSHMWDQGRWGLISTKGSPIPSLR